ncbi:MAG: glutamate racemase [Phycisphaerales bacterium]|nr:glutamate racemase [Phycisphaerales bacterium]
MSVGAPLGVFDSGLGGLTVVKALRVSLPQESIAYFGDTARLPYGTKSPATVYQFTRQCLRFLMSLRPKLLVVACNTASALALAELRGEFEVPIVGVLEPGAKAAVEVTREKKGGGGKRGGLIATEATIASNAYPAAIRRLDPQVQVIGRACPLLVPMIEEGREPTDVIVGLVLREYLTPFLELDISTLILGCTHYPLFADAIAQTLGAGGGGVKLIDSAKQTALVVREQLDTMNARSTSSGAPPTRPPLTCYVTDQGQRFERLASRFLGESVGQPVWVTPEMLEL